MSMISGESETAPYSSILALERQYLSQHKAYLAIQAMTAPEGVPDEIFVKIKALALENHPDSFTLQKSAIKN